MQCPKVAIFDLDDTLAESFQAPTIEMKIRIDRLAGILPVAIMTGAGFPRIERDVLSGMQNVSNNFYLFPNSGTQCFLYEDASWRLEYNEILTPEQREEIKQAIRECQEELPEIHAAPHMGDQIIDRETQIAYTIVGVDTPREMKKSWDPDSKKRSMVADALRRKIGQYDIFTGGTSTVDISRKGINKAYGVEWLARHLNIPTKEMLYVGDALYPGGNDAVVIPTGIQTIMVASIDETAKIIDELLSVCG